MKIKDMLCSDCRVMMRRKTILRIPMTMKDFCKDCQRKIEKEVF